MDGHDLLVVGAGTAGLPAAIFAARRGMRVLLVEKLDRVGGTLHVAQGQLAAAGTSLQRERGIEDSPDLHFADVMRISRGTASTSRSVMASPRSSRRRAPRSPSIRNRARSILPMS